ncbi:hypothetical protein HWX16_12985 [Ochrobactrum intermedium]|uniref:hypothetical protein n=1 Tax=Brucella intermedia TaxID=94625 RepID=UPI00159C8D5F|nr:hypothetical protein [Brucella intermedia]NVM41242.1 hypothetical protein [Brucella intermedia]
MARARLTNEEIEQIIGLLTTWQGKLSWELLLQRVEMLLRRPFTRQGLDKQSAIRTAFKQAKNRTRIGKQAPAEGLPEILLLNKTIDSLRSEIAVLKAERDRFYEKFATWHYNARSRGLAEVDLNRPLPAIDRGKSERDKPERIGKKPKK